MKYKSISNNSAQALAFPFLFIYNYLLNLSLPNVRFLWLILAVCGVNFNTLAQSAIDESAVPSAGISYQNGPGTNNTTNWTYPFGAKLTVYGNAHRNFELVNTSKGSNASLAMRTYNDTGWTPWRTFVFMNSSGNVGIGTHSPGYTLEVEKTNANNNQEYILGAFNHSGNAGGVYLGYLGDGTDAKEARLRSGGNIPLALGTTVDREAIYITNPGLVGIGTKSPLEELQIGSQWTFHDGGHKIIGYNTHYNGGSKRILAGHASTIRLSDAGDIRLETAVSDNAGTSISWIQGLAIRNDGNVGVGATNPIDKFVVNGTSRLGANDGTGLIISKFTSNLSDVPGSPLGSQFIGPRNGHVVLDIRGDEPSDGFYVRVPTTLKNDPTVDKTAFVVKSDGKVGIGTINTHGYELAVAGGILTEKVYVKLQANWPDYVFNSRYNLRSLEDTEAFIEENHHLPEIPSAQEVAINGYDLGQMNAKLLQKIEELTLHLIDQNKVINELLEDNQSLKSDVEALKVSYNK